MTSARSSASEHEVASYKHPERLELIDVLPRNPVGKVVKPELRELWSHS
jgi:non-ribosomal peptide synthetase component E (peptide arylation enzyme)